MEVHAELQTRSKMFCRCEVAFGGEPNTRVCPVCLGMPGSLPVANKAAIQMVLKTALALNCQIAYHSIFHRKNYFYPDLPKGYQISQYGETNPIGYDGYLEIPTPQGALKRIKITRVHLEEDTGKLMHLPAGGSGVDYNRAGVPLMEIVTAFPPDIANAEEAKEYLVQLRQILLYLGVCDGKMEEGSLRCEPNISVRLEGSDQYGTKTELKNLNSFRSVQLGVQFEVKRQIDALERGERLHQETRGWNEGTQSSFVMRTKESENDYRYFPDPDLVPMDFDEGFVEQIRASIPELPLARSTRYQMQLSLTSYDADWLVDNRPAARFFDDAVRQGGDPKQVFNWLSGDLTKMLNDSGQSLSDDPGSESKLCRITPSHLVELTSLISEGAITGKMAKDVFKEVFETGQSPQAIVQERGLAQVQDSGTVESWVREVLAENPEVVAKFRAGQIQVVGFLVGQVMKKSQGRANPGLVQETINKELSPNSGS